MLEITLRNDGLRLALYANEAIGENALAVSFVALERATDGTITAPALDARSDPDTTNEEEIDTFLGLLVRAAFTADLAA